MGAAVGDEEAEVILVAGSGDPQGLEHKGTRCLGKPDPIREGSGVVPPEGRGKGRKFSRLH